MAAPAPRIRSVTDIKHRLFQPALTSHYECHFHIPNTFPSIKQGTASSFIGKRVPVTSELTNLITLSCSEASLPGSQLATHDLNNDFTGVSQKHAYRRLYDDRADFTFYVNTSYTQIRLFERWIQFISGEQEATAANLNSFYRMVYPKAYKTQIYITKFERDLKKANSKLSYTFFNAFPISIASMPISYEASQLLKVSVSFSFDRYVAENVSAAAGPSEPQQPSVPGVPVNISPEQQAVLNSNSIFNSTQGFDFGIAPDSLSNNFSTNALNRQPNIGVGAGTLAENNQITIQRANDLGIG